MSNINKKRGNNWEYEIRDFLQPYFKKKIITTRQGSQALDNQKVDLMFEDGSTLDFPPQCKSTQSFQWTWLEELLPNGIVFWKRMKKVNKNQKCIGKYVIMDLETFKNLIRKDE